MNGYSQLHASYKPATRMNDEGRTVSILRKTSVDITHFNPITLSCDILQFKKGLDLNEESVWGSGSDFYYTFQHHHRKFHVLKLPLKEHHPL